MFKIGDKIRIKQKYIGRATLFSSTIIRNKNKNNFKVVYSEPYGVLCHFLNNTDDIEQVYLYISEIEKINNFVLDENLFLL
jgi:hypothetical protein